MSSAARVGWSLTAIGVMAFITTQARADDYYTSVPFLPTVLIGEDSEGATPVEEVYGKEYSHTNFDEATTIGDPRLINIDDHDAGGVPDPLQVVSWDGLRHPVTDNSGSVDAFDFGAMASNLPPEGQVDALANGRDFLFRQVVRNEASLLFSVTGDAIGNVHYEDPAGGEDVWAKLQSPTGPGAGVNHHPVSDVDALEVWGPEPPSHENEDSLVEEGYIGAFNTADANRFSLDEDVLTGVSVWAYDIPTKAVGPWIPHSEIVKAVETLFLGPGLEFDSRTRNMIDVDGTMARDLGDTSPGGSPWDAGDELLFTIDPIDDAVYGDPASGSGGVLTIDGGEIIHLVNLGGGLIDVTFLEHGGHTWDTAFKVMDTFGYEFEDIDALEAVGTLTGDTEIPTPEPSTLILGAIAALLGLRQRT